MIEHGKTGRGKPAVKRPQTYPIIGPLKRDDGINRLFAIALNPIRCIRPLTTICKVVSRVDQMLGASCAVGQKINQAFTRLTVLSDN